MWSCKKIYFPIFNRFIVTNNQLNGKIKEMKRVGIHPIIDYCIESKGNGKNVVDETINCMEKFPGNYFAVKISGLGKNHEEIWNNVKYICDRSTETNNKIMIDAEYDSIHNKIIDISNELIKKYNQQSPIVHKTYQMYRKDSFRMLEEDINVFGKMGLKNGIKLVRGAYWKQDIETGNLFDKIGETHKNYNDAIKLIFEKTDQEKDSVIFATHNQESIEIVKQFGEIFSIPNNSIKIAQLMGMKDITISYPSLEQGYHVMKYVPYGPPLETIPYLLRRLEENKYMIFHIL
jgi:proline dehydrogenase